MVPEHIVNNGYELLSPYKNADTHIAVRCVYCHHMNISSPKNLWTCCKKCMTLFPHNEHVRKRIMEGKNILLSKGVIKAQCMSCEEWFDASIGDIRKKKVVCPACVEKNKSTHPNKKLAETELRKYLSDLGFFLTDYSVYKDRLSPLPLVCNNCNKSLERSLQSFVQTKRCPHCSPYGNTPKPEQVVAFLKNKGFKRVGEEEYVDRNTKMKLCCLTCDKEVVKSSKDLYYWKCKH
jgi:hypothetical protein